MKSTDFLNMPTDPIRAALERLISAYDEHGGRWPQHDEDALHDAVERARVALAAEPLDPAAGGEALLATAAAPLEGEVGQLVAWLRSEAEINDSYELTESAAFQRRAATLIQQQAAELAALRAGVVSVAVSDRPWEREGWCDEQGRCWMGDPGGGGFIPSWRLCRPEDAPNMKVSLPFHAIPLPVPQGVEVEE